MSVADPTFAVEELALNGDDEWDRFVDESVEATPFSKIAWLRAFNTNSPKNNFSIGVIRDKAGKISAGMTLLRTVNKLGQPVAIVPGLHPYNSFLFRPLATTELDRIYRHRRTCTEALMKFAKQGSFASIRLIHHPDVSDVRPFVWDGWQVVPAYTFLVDLLKFEEVASFSHANRKQHRKCVEAGFKLIQHDKVQPHTETILTLLRKTFERQGLDPNRLDPHHGGLEAYARYIEQLDKTGMLRYFAAQTADGQTVSARVGVVSANGTIYDWIAGTDPDFLKQGAAVFLIAEVLMELKRAGFKQFDFGGANTPSIADFKQGFNGELIMGFETLWASPALRHMLARVAGTMIHGLRNLAT